MFFIETPLDAAHEAKAFWAEEEEEAPSPGSPTDSWQGDPSSCAKHKACRDNKQSHKKEVENKENQTKRKAKTKRAETSKEPVLSMSHGSMVIDCLDGSMITWSISSMVTVMLKTGTATLGQSVRNHGFTTLPLRGWVWKE